MKNLIVAIGGSGGFTLRSLKYRLKLFNTLKSLDEKVEEVYIDALALNMVESGTFDQNTDVSDKSYRTLAPFEMSSFLPYRGAGTEFIAKLLEVEEEGRRFNNEEINQRYAYRWFDAHHYNKIGAVGNLQNFLEGCGRYRQFGRMLIDTNYEAIAQELKHKIENMGSSFKVFMIFSVAGGTGAGAAFDTAMILRKIATIADKTPMIYALIVMGGAFNLEDPAATYGSLRELARLDSRDQNAGYTTNYQGNLDNRAVLNQKLFDSKFIIDFNQKVAGLEDDNLRYLGLYPSLADLIELMIQPDASNTIYDQAANWANTIQKARDKKDDQIIAGAHDHGMLKRGLSKKDNDWYVTYKTQRIFFPKNIYLDISRDELVCLFLKELFPSGDGLELQDNISLKTGKEANEKALTEEKNERCYRILSSWNKGFMVSVTKEADSHEGTFVPEEHGNKFDNISASSIDNIVYSLFIGGVDPTPIIEKDIVKDLKPMIVGDATEVNTFINRIKHYRDAAEKTIEKKFESLDTAHKNSIRLHMAQYALDMLNTVIPSKKGTLGFTREFFRFLAFEYLNKIDVRLARRGADMLEEHGKLVVQCDEQGSEPKKAALSKKLRRTAQADLLAMERDRLMLYRGKAANSKLKMYIDFAIQEAKHWHESLQGWESNLVGHSMHSLLVRAAKSIEQSKRVLKELAMSSGVSLGLPKHEFRAGGKDGGQSAQVRSFDTVKIDMGGFQKHVHSLLKPEGLIQKWVRDFKWTTVEPLLNKDDLPSNSVIKSSVPIMALTGGEGLPSDKDLYQQLDTLVQEAAEGPIGGINLFTYLTDWAPKNGDKDSKQIAEEIGKHFVVSKHYLECDQEPGLWHSYLAYNPGKSDIGDFMANVGKHSIESKEPPPTEIQNYGDGNSLAFIHFAVGVTIESAKSLREPRDLYLGHIIRQRSTRGKDGHYIGESLTNHIFPEEQAMMRFEIEDLEVQIGKEFSVNDFIPIEFSPLFQDLDRLDLFVRLYSADLIRVEPDKNGFIFYYRQDFDLNNETKPHDRFVLAQGKSLIGAARKFVANDKNVDDKSYYDWLPTLAEMEANLDRYIDNYYLKNEDTIADLRESDFPQEEMWHDTVLINLIDEKYEELKKLTGVELADTFNVSFGLVRDMAKKSTLQNIMLHFFRIPMTRLTKLRDAKKPKQRLKNRKYK